MFGALRHTSPRLTLLLARLPGLELGLPPPEGGVMSTSLQARISLMGEGIIHRLRLTRKTHTLFTYGILKVLSDNPTPCPLPNSWGGEIEF